MRYHEIIAETLAFRGTMRGHHSGQSDMTLLAIQDGKSVGRIDYSLYGDDVAVQMIDVDPACRRQGIGRALLLKLQAMFPQTEIDLGMLTDDGGNLVASMASDLEPNPDVIADQERLQAVQSELASLQVLADRIEAGEGLPGDQERLRASFDRWNDLHDEERDLEDALIGRKSHRRIFR